VADEVKQSPIFSRFAVTVIPYGINTNEFAPRNRANARDLLGIPSEARVVLFIAEDVSNRRKGFSLLLAALEKCAPRIPNLMLLSMGRNAPDIKINLPYMHQGFSDNSRFLSIVYSAADVYATCALQEGFGLTTLEAMACGTPVIAFGVGGARDMIRNGTNGFAVEEGDVDAFAESTCAILNDNLLRQRMSEKAREVVIEEYPTELQARRYAELYSELIRNNQP
jgi:glycosyltransferase involved in cell wall biosynthesis